MKSLQGPPKPLSGEPKNMKKLQSLCPRLCFTVLALAALFVSITGATAFAQTAGAGSINGTVSDAAQAAIPGAVVTVTNTDTGVIHTYTTNSTGLYSAPFLQPGHYKVEATAPNFGKVQIANVKIESDRSKADVSVTDNNGETPLHRAAAGGHMDIVKLLVASGADVNAKTNRGGTPLHSAAFNGHKDVVQLLRQHGGHE